MLIDEIDATVFDDAGWKGVTAGLVRLAAGERESLSPEHQQKWDALPKVVARATMDSASGTPGVIGFAFDEVRDWLASVGARKVTAFAIVRTGNRHDLHVTEHMYADGSVSPLVDFASGAVVTAPRVIPLTDTNWPACINGPAFTADRGAALPTAMANHPVSA